MPGNRPPHRFVAPLRDVRVRVRVQTIPAYGTPCHRLGWLRLQRFDMLVFMVFIFYLIIKST